MTMLRGTSGVPNNFLKQYRSTYICHSSHVCIHARGGHRVASCHLMFVLEYSQP